MSTHNILFFNEEIDFRLRDKNKLRRWIYASMALENKAIGSINFIFSSDRYLHQLNLEYLRHDTLTDVITFDYTEDGRALSGDVFISIDRIRENAKQFRTTFAKELHRVMIHGVLHLAGYKDKTTAEKARMKAKEDYCLSLQAEFFGN